MGFFFFFLRRKTNPHKKKISQHWPKVHYERMVERLSSIQKNHVGY